MLNSIYLDATFDLMGTPILAKMKIVLSPVPTSNDYIKKFMEEVEDDLSRLPKHDAVANTVSMLGQVLKLTKTIMDQVSKVRRRHQCLYILTLTVNLLIVAFRHTQYSTHHGPLFPVFTRCIALQNNKPTDMNIRYYPNRPYRRRISRMTPYEN